MNPDYKLIELIRQLKDKYKIALLSNAGKEEIEIIYRDEIDLLFDVLAVSYDVGTIKPDPKIFLVCAQRLGLEPAQCLFVDDSLPNLEAAKRVQMKALHYPKFAAIPDELNNLVR